MNKLKNSINKKLNILRSGNPKHSIWFPQLYISYLVLTLVFSGLGIYKNSFVQTMLHFVGNMIPAIGNFAVIAPVQERAQMELFLAWLLSLIFPVLFVKQLDWKFLEDRHKHLGGPVVAIMVGLIVGAITVLICFLQPTPSSTGRGRFVSFFFENNLAFLWGAAILLVLGLGWSFILTSLILIKRMVFKN